jgi:organic hydroperoxide reductase OsmC/OhrA
MAAVRDVVLSIRFSTNGKSLFSRPPSNGPLSSTGTLKPEELRRSPAAACFARSAHGFVFGDFGFQRHYTGIFWSVKLKSSSGGHLPPMFQYFAGNKNFRDRRK